MKKVIWRDKESLEHEVCAEDQGKDFKVSAITAIAELCTESLNVHWAERRIVTQLLKSAIGYEIGDILKQYLHSQLEIIGKEFNREFGIEEAIEPGYATHAKMNNFVDSLKKKLG